MPDYKLLTIIIPAFNERNTVAESIRRVREAPLDLEREIIVVDDGSRDGTLDIVKRLSDSTRCRSKSRSGTCTITTSRRSRPARQDS